MDKNGYTTIDPSKENNNTSATTGFFSKIKKQFSREETPFTAESCYIQSKYGSGSFKPIEERIADKQAHIRSVIRSKFAPGTNENTLNYSSFHAVIDIEEDLVNHINNVFKPFIEAGFQIIDLSKECKSIDNESYIYLISWKNAFKEKK